MPDIFLIFFQGMWILQIFPVIVEETALTTRSAKTSSNASIEFFAVCAIELFCPKCPFDFSSSRLRKEG
jgi:hypothetical protein